MILVLTQVVEQSSLQGTALVLLLIMRQLQLPISSKEKALHKKYGHKGIGIVRGAGRLNQPDLTLIFMNPTARNTSSNPNWKGIRAPWIGTKQVWNMLAKLGLIDKDIIPETWDENSALELYKHVAESGLYITNLASCTQPDARPLPNSLFREYLPVVYEEIDKIKPKKIISFGNQVSSIFLQKSISVSNYTKVEFEVFKTKTSKHRVYPTYYPVGQGQRNMPRAAKRISLISN